MKKSDQKLTLLYFFNDVLLLNIAITLMLLVKYTTIPDRYKLFYLIYNLTWIFVALVNNIYSLNWRKDFRAIIRFNLINVTIYTGIISVVLLLVKEPVFSRLIVYGSILLLLFLKIISGYFLFRLVGILRSRGKNIRRILILGAGRSGRKINDIIQKNPELGFKIVGFLDDKEKENELSEMILGKLDDLSKVLSSVNIDEIIIALPLYNKNLIQSAINYGEHYGIRIRLIPDFYKLLGRSFEISKIGDLPVINVREVPLDDLMNCLLKRTFDICFSFIIVLLFSPLYLLISLIIILESKGPVLYCPVRIGNNGEKFRLLKFRTMSTCDDEFNGKQSTEPDDHRITRFGNLLRKYNIDEMPQFFNVLKGEMSVVGPRPHRSWLDELLKNDVHGYMVRHHMKPGITGWAQVNGWRGLLDTQEKKVQRVKHDLWYMENWSFWLDLKIIFLTLFSKKARQNCY